MQRDSAQPIEPDFGFMQPKLMPNDTNFGFMRTYCTPLFEMVGPLGFEPRTKGFT